MHWLSHILGLDNLSGPWYGWWSGSGSDLGEVAIIGGLIGMFRRHNCHVHGCKRIGRHEVIDPATGAAHLVCRRHHPAGAPSADDIQRMHRDSLAESPTYAR